MLCTTGRATWLAGPTLSLQRGKRCPRVRNTITPSIDVPRPQVPRRPFDGGSDALAAGTRSLPGVMCVAPGSRAVPSTGATIPSREEHDRSIESCAWLLGPTLSLRWGQRCPPARDASAPGGGPLPSRSARRCTQESRHLHPGPGQSPHSSAAFTPPGGGGFASRSR